MTISTTSPKITPRTTNTRHPHQRQHDLVAATKQCEKYLIATYFEQKIEQRPGESGNHALVSATPHHWQRPPTFLTAHGAKSPTPETRHPIRIPEAAQNGYLPGAKLGRSSRSTIMDARPPLPARTRRPTGQILACETGGPPETTTSPDHPGGQLPDSRGFSHLYAAGSRHRDALRYWTRCGFRGLRLSLLLRPHLPVSSPLHSFAEHSLSLSGRL
jgi:hypothetical protein